MPSLSSFRSTLAPRFSHWIFASVFLIMLRLSMSPLLADDLSGAVTDLDREISRSWHATNLTGQAACFSFKYNGKSSRDFLSDWNRTEQTSKSGVRATTTTTFVDPASDLEIRQVTVTYDDYPVTEWTLYFRNHGSQESPVISDIQAIDSNWVRKGESEFVLHHTKGANASRTDYWPSETRLGWNQELTLRSVGGRPCNGNLPFFNVNWLAPHRGVIICVGWPGQWEANFQRDDTEQLTVTAGQQDCHFKLMPGEEFRSPLIAVMHYQGDWIRGQNLWRRWMVQHNLPRPKGKLPPHQLLACSSHQFSEMLKANEENQKQFVDRYLEEGFPLAYWWMDAGWYSNDGTWQNTGTWEVDRKRFPNGLRAITDHMHNKGVKSIVWFEPERVTSPSWLYDNRPEWLLTPPPNPGRRHYDNNWRLLNLGNNEAREWLTNHVDSLIKSEGIDLYRQDFNVAPLHFWRSVDNPDRQGIAENKYVQGYLAYWDALLERNDGLRIDSCASGGRRNDLETLRRSVPLLRSDSLFEATGQQCHTYGMSFWIPYYGTGTHVGTSEIGQEGSHEVDVYAFRSQMSPSLTACWDMRDESLDYDTLRKLASQHQKAAANYMGDYYPLSNYAPNDELDAWVAWQWFRPEAGKGVVHAFRRDQSKTNTETYQLFGLDPHKTYLVQNADEAPQPVYKMSGQQLLDEGLVITLPQPRTAALLFIEQVE